MPQPSMNASSTCAWPITSLYKIVICGLTHSPSRSLPRPSIYQQHPLPTFKHPPYHTTCLQFTILTHHHTHFGTLSVAWRSTHSSKAMADYQRTASAVTPTTTSKRLPNKNNSQPKRARKFRVSSPVSMTTTKTLQRSTHRP